MIEFFETLRKIETVILKAMGPKLHELGFSKTDIFIMTQLYYKTEARMSEFSRTIGIPASSFTSIIDRLVKKNLVIRENDTNDRRSIIIRSTPELKKIVEHIFSIGNEVLADVLQPVPESLVERVTVDLNELYSYISTENNDGKSVK